MFNKFYSFIVICHYYCKIKLLNTSTEKKKVFNIQYAMFGGF